MILTRYCTPSSKHFEANFVLDSFEIDKKNGSKPWRNRIPYGSFLILCIAIQISLQLTWALISFVLQFNYSKNTTTTTTTTWHFWCFLWKSQFSNLRIPFLLLCRPPVLEDPIKGHGQLFPPN